MFAFLMYLIYLCLILGGFILAVLVILAAAGVITAAFSPKGTWKQERRKRMDFPGQVSERWRNEGRTVPFEPVLLLLLATQPQRPTTGPYILGVLGIVDDKLAFEGMNGERYQIPLNAICWIGRKTTPVQERETITEKEVLVIHADYDGQWNVFTLGAGSIHLRANSPNTLDYQARTFTHTLVERCQLELHMYSGTHEDFGPAQAQQISQDVYGQWHEDNADGSPLYLAPDRLIYGWKDMIHLAQIRKLDVYAEGTRRSINPFAQDLLRIEYDADGNHVVTGFLLRRADEWGAELAKRTGVPCDLQEGRKKKNGDL
ncbi:MAG TPA: hypothetical protein VHP83_10940 [Aggregatilineaceae bacterium]|nr:hypothetical protein [Aggregatilineaceae bacterium]